jgi:hypothetical protein
MTFEEMQLLMQSILTAPDYQPEQRYLASLISIDKKSDFL